MVEYIEREAAIKKLDHFQSHLHTVEGTCAIGVAKTLIKEIPAADVRSAECCEECRAALLGTIDHYKQLCDAVRPVVLCRDCKYNAGAKTWIDNDITADCTNGHGYPPLDWFCADGEKREEN